MKVQNDLMYSKTHEWIRVEGSKAKVGLSDHAQAELGDIVYINLPAVGEKVNCGKPFADIESVKAVSEIISPVCGKILAVNAELDDKPEIINEDCYSAWIMEVEFVSKEDLMNAEEYTVFCQK